MRKLIVFNNVSLDGYFVDKGGSMQWAHRVPDEEWNAFTAQNASGGGLLLFGRVTYELMAGFWPTPEAIQNFPVVAERMNNGEKIVFSRKMEKTSWKNTTLVRGDLVAEVRKMKEKPGPGMAILGSGSIVAQLAPEGLIDEYQMAVIPVVLGAGRTMFEGISKNLNLKLTKTRTFKNGNVFLCYEPLT
jgi:dihydrofolate reductase